MRHFEMNALYEAGGIFRSVLISVGVDFWKLGTMLHRMLAFGEAAQSTLDWAF